MKLSINFETLLRFELNCQVQQDVELELKLVDITKTT